MIDNKKKEVNISRSKRADLTREFEDFKQKIQEFENKNEQIINRIREAYTFKKKAVENQNPRRQIDPRSRVVYYDRGDEVNSVASSCDYSKNMVLEGNLMGFSDHSREPQVIQYQQHHPRPYSSQLLEKDSEQPPFFRCSNLSSRAINSNQAVPPGNFIKPGKEVYQDYEAGRSKKITGKFIDQEFDWQEKVRSLAQRNQQLEQTISAQEEELERIRGGGENKLKNYASALKRLVSDQIENYHEQVVLQRLLQMQKYFRKCDNRLRKLQLHLKDSIQDRKTRSAIKISRAKRRSSSKSKHRNSEISSADLKESWVSGPNRETVKIPVNRKVDSQNKSNNEKQKEFTQIAAGYETMIKTKTEEIEKLEKQVKQEMRGKETAASELARVKCLLEENQKLIEELRTPVRNDKEEQVIKQNKQLKQTLQRIQEEVRLKQQKQKELNGALQKLQKNKKSSNQQQKESFNKTINKKNQTIAELQEKLKESQAIYLKEIGQMKERVLNSDKQNMEKECQILTLANKIKKIETDLLLKDQKLKQLQSILTKDNDPDFLQRSMSVDNSLLTSNQFRGLQEALRRQEDDNEHKLLLIEELEKQKYELQVELQSNKTEFFKLQKDLQSVRRKMVSLQREEDEKDSSNERENYRQLQERLVFLEEGEHQRLDLIEEREGLVTKNNELLEDLKKLKEQNLTLNRDLIKINSKLNFNHSEYSSLQEKMSKAKEQNVDLRLKLNNQISSFEDKEKGYINQIKDLKITLQQYQRRISDLESCNQGEEKDEENLLNSIHASEVSFNVTAGRMIQEEEVVILREKLKEAETALELKQSMEQQIQSQYRQNLQRIRGDLGEKNAELKKIQGDNDELKKQIKSMHLQQKEDVSFQNYKISLYEQKIIQLEAELNSCRQSQAKLNELLHELTENMRDQSEEKVKLSNEIEQKERQLEELKELLEIKQIKDIQKDPLKDSKDNKREEGKDLFLRMSGDQSEEMSDVAEISYFSNISDVFKRDEVLQDKMKRGKTSREEFIRLFTKTSAYIKSLKDIIEGKDKRIKSLERQMGNIKNEKGSWNIKEKKISETKAFRTENDRDDSMEEYKDYDSVQIDTRRSKAYELTKELQHEKELAVEENKMLMNQIELLQDELSRAEEQENSLVRIKDLYKDEIKKLMQKNEVHTQQFEMQIKRLRDQLDQSESYHNWQALKQLFVKMISCIGAMEDQTNKLKRQQKRKELEEFVKVLISILKLEPQLRDKLMASIRK